MTNNNKMNLNFDWKFSETFKLTYLQEGINDKFDMVNVPHTNKILPLNYFDEKCYQFISAYEKVIFIGENLKEKLLFLTFDGVSNYSKVYVNGIEVGEHKCGYTAFSFDIAPFVNYGSDNRILVMVDSTERSDVPPFGGAVDYLTFGGIYREVYIDVKDKNYIDNVKIFPADIMSKPKINVQLSLPMQGNITIEIKDNDNNLLKTEKITSNGKFLQSFPIDKPILWDINNPYLYTIDITLSGENGTDFFTARCGLRHARFYKDGFYLNNKKIKLVGLNRHQAYPYVGYAMPKSMQVADADMLKFNLGCNIVRTSHYPQSHHFIDRCDEIGLLVFTEIPGWQHIGNEDWQGQSCANTAEMILQWFNHTSIILWGVRINESGDCDSFYQKTSNIARALDTTRQCGGVRCQPNSRLLEDVYTFNDFNHTGKNRGVRNKFVVTKKKNPYLVTEHNGHIFPTKSFDNEPKRTEHALRHLRVINQTMLDKNTAGCIGWCMADYNTHSDFGSGDKICYHGVLDMFRIEKIGAMAYQSQRNSTPFLGVQGGVPCGDYDRAMVLGRSIFTNADFVEIYKGNELVAKASGDKKQFKGLLYPPIQFSDVVANALEKDEKMSPKKAKAVANMLKAILGVVVFNIKDAARLLLLPFSMLINGISPIKIGKLYNKYMNPWGQFVKEFRVVGYKDGKIFDEATMGVINSAKLTFEAVKINLVEDATYDVTEVKIRAIGNTGEVLRYFDDAMTLTADGAVEIIGDTTVSLIGGVRGVYVKTKGVSGKGTLTINSPKFGTKIIEFDVQKI